VEFSLKNQAGSRCSPREKLAEHARERAWCDQNLMNAFVKSIHGGFKLSLHSAGSDTFLY